MIQNDKIALDDHSYTATREERSLHEKSWTPSLNAEGVQGPLNQRSDFREAKQTCKSLYQEFSAIIGSGKNLSLQSNKSDKGEIDSLKALKHMHQRIRLHLPHQDGNRAATCDQR